MQLLHNKCELITNKMRPILFKKNKIVILQAIQNRDLAGGRTILFYLISKLEI